MAKVIAKATERLFPTNRASCVRRTDTDVSRQAEFSQPADKNCWVCRKAGHISRSCPEKR